MEDNSAPMNNDVPETSPATEPSSGETTQPDETTETTQPNAPEQNAPAAENEDYEGLVTREDGTKWIPKERLDQVLSKLDEAKNLSANFLDVLKTDPEKRAEFMQVLSDLEKEGAEPGPQPFEKWVNESVAKEHREHYMALGQAFASEFHSYVQQQLAPILSFIGETRLDQTASKLPDFDRYKADVYKVMKQYPGIPPEMAYTWVTRNKTFKQGEDAARAKFQNKPKGPAAPIKNSKSNAAPTKQNKSFAERLMEKMDGQG